MGSERLLPGEVIRLLERIHRRIEHDFPFVPKQERLCIEHERPNGQRFFYLAYGYADSVCFVDCVGEVEPFACGRIHIVQGSVQRPELVLDREIRHYTELHWMTFDEQGEVINPVR